MTIKRKTLKGLREGHDENLPTHPSAAGVQIPDKLKEEDKDKLKEGAAKDLPTYASDAAAEVPDSLGGKLGNRSVKSELDGEAVANASGKHGDAEGKQLPEETEDEKKVSEEDEAKKEDELTEEEKKDEELKEEEKASEDEEKKKVSEEEEKAEDKKLDEEDDEELKEHISALIRGEVLPEEFKTKAATLFETAVKTCSARRVEVAKKKLSEDFNKKLSSETSKISESLVDKVDGYLDYVVEEWMSQNALAIEPALKSEITEKFISGLKNLFEANYVEFPQAKLDLFEKQTNKIEELEKSLNEEINRGVELKKTIIKFEKEAILEKLSEGLTDLDASKFRKFCEKVSFEDSNSYGQKLKVIKESYLPKGGNADKANTLSEVVDGGLKGEHKDPVAETSPMVKAAADQISKFLKN